MTTNQINYWNLQNEKFKASETARSNRANEAIDLSRLAETKRHNIAGEGLDLSKLAETRRSNLENERISQLRSDRDYDLGIRQILNQLQIAITNAGATKYAADRNAAAQKYSSDNSKYAAMYSADRNKEASQYSADASRQASKYNADQHYYASKYNSDVTSEYQHYAADLKHEIDTITVGLKQIGLIQEAQRIELEYAKLDEAIRHNESDEAIRAIGAINSTIQSVSQLTPMLVQ